MSDIGITEKDSYVYGSTFTSGTLWAGRTATGKMPDMAEQALTTITQWDPVDGERLVRWCWRRRLGWIAGCLVTRAVLGSAVAWLREHGPVPLDIATATMSNRVVFVIRSAVGRVAIVSPANVDEGDEKRYSHFEKCTTLDDRHPIMGKPVAGLWFDDDGNGPSVIEVSVQATNIGTPDLDARVTMEFPGLQDGGAFFSTEAMREIARQATAAADWCEARDREAKASKA